MAHAQNSSFVGVCIVFEALGESVLDFQRRCEEGEITPGNGYNYSGTAFAGPRLHTFRLPADSYR